MSSMNKSIILPYLFLFAGLTLGILSFGIYKSFSSSSQPVVIPPYITHPEAPENLVGYKFETFLSAPAQLENVRGFSLDDSGRLFLILAQKLYLVGLRTPIAAQADLPEQIDNNPIGKVTAVDWAPGIPTDTPTVYLGTSSGVFQWTVPVIQPEQESELKQEPDNAAVPNLAKRFTEGFTDKSKVDAIRFWGGKLFVADSGLGQVRVYDQISGKLLQNVDLASLSPPCGNKLYIDIQRKNADEYVLWVADRDNSRFVPIWSDGSCNASQIWVCKNDKMKQFQGSRLPAHFVIEPSGEFIVSECAYPYVKKYRADGTFECIVAGARAFNWSKSDTPFVTAFEGQIYILAPESGLILQFSPKQ